MAMQYDVKAAEVTSTGSVYATRARIKGLTISFASGGTVVLTDGETGATRFSYTAPAAAGSVNILMPGEGILCDNSIYATLTDATATVYYG